MFKSKRGKDWERFSGVLFYLLWVPEDPQADIYVFAVRGRIKNWEEGKEESCVLRLSKKGQKYMFGGNFEPSDVSGAYSGRKNNLE